MKVLLRKVWFCAIIIIIAYVFIIPIVHIYKEDWIALIKWAFLVSYGFLLSHFEVLDVIKWKCKKVFKYNDFGE